MSDIETRVDQAFATAVSDQLHEQREIRRLVARVDESMVALSDGLVDLSQQLSGTAQQLSGSVVTPEDLQRVRGDLAAAIERVDDQIAAVAQRVGDTEALEELRGLMSSTRIDLIESMARLERGSAPVAEAVDETRREVLRALERLGQTVDSTRDAGWIEAIDRLDAVVGAFERRQHDRDDAGEAALHGLRAEAEAALVGLRDATEQRLVEAVEHVVHQQLEALGADTAGRTAAQLTHDIGRTLDGFARDAAAGAASQSVGLAEQIARDAARDAVAALSHGADALSEHAAAHVAQAVAQAAEQAARGAAERVLAALESAGHQLQADLTGTAGVMDATAVRTAEVLERLDRGTEETARQLEGTIQGAATAAEERMQQLAARAAETVIDLTAETTARSSELAGLLERLDQVTGSLDPQIRGVLDGVSGSLAELLDRHHRATAETIEQALSVMVRHNGEALEDLRSSVDSAVRADTAEVNRALDSMAEVSATLSEGVIDAVARATEQLTATHQAGAAQMEAVTRELQQLPGEVRTPVLGLLTQMQEGVAAVVADLNAASLRMGDRIEPTIREAMVEARAALIAVISDSQDRTDASLGALTEATGAAAGEVSAAATGVRAATEGVSAEVRDAAEAVIARLTEAEVTSVAALTSTLDGTVSESAAALRSVQAEVAAELRSAVEDMTSAHERTRSSVEQSLSAITGSLQGSLEGQLQGLLAQLAASGQDQQAHAALLRETAQDLAEQLQETWERGSHGVQTAAESARQQLIDTAEQMVARMEASGSDVTTGLATRVDHASARVDDASARITEALARLDDAGASLTRQLADAGQVVAGQFTGDVESATARLRSDLDTTLASTAERLATTGEAAAEALSARVTEAGDRIDRARSAIDEAARTSASTATEVRSTGEQLGQLLTATGEDVVAALTAALTDVTTGMSDASAGTATHLERLLTSASEQVQAAVAAAQADLRSEMAEVRETTRGEAERQQRATGQIEQTAVDVVAEVAAILERIDAGIDERLGRADAVITEQLTRLGGVESDAAVRMETRVTEVSDRLGAELEQTRAALRESITAGSDTSQVNLTAIRTEVERLLATMTARVGDLEETVATAAEVTDQRSRTTMAQLQALAGDTVGEVSAQLEAVQQAVGSHLGEADSRRAEDIDRVAGVAQRMERAIEALPSEVAAVVEQVRVAMLDSTQDVQRRQTNSFTEMTTTVQGLRAEVTEAVARLSRRSGEGGGVPMHRLDDLEAMVSGIEGLMAGMEVRITEAVQQGLAQQLQIDGARTRADAHDVTAAAEAGLADLRAGMRADADAVLDAMAQRADDVLGGLATHSEVVLSSLQQAEEALRGRLAEVGQQESRTAEALRELSDQVAALAAREDRHRWAQPRPGASPTDATPPPPPAPRRRSDDGDVVTPRALGHVCPDCGFVAKTPPGLAAHRRTCLSGAG